MTTEHPTDTFIYALCHPKTDEIGYVGKSDNPRRRLVEHLAKRTGKSKRAKWIRKLDKQLLRPKIVVLETVKYEEWKEAEKSGLKNVVPMVAN